MSYGNLGEGITMIFVICLLAMPLAAWKLIDILLWLLANVQIGLR